MNSWPVPAGERAGRSRRRQGQYFDIADKNKERLRFCRGNTIFLPQLMYSVIYTRLNYVTEKKVLMLLGLAYGKNKSA